MEIFQTIPRACSVFDKNSTDQYFAIDLKNAHARILTKKCAKTAVKTPLKT